MLFFSRDQLDSLEMMEQMESQDHQVHLDQVASQVLLDLMENQ